MYALKLSNKPGELWKWPCHGDNTINIVLLIIKASVAKNTNARLLH